jgi:four helix bundle protein
MHDYTRLRVWQRAQKLILEIHQDSEGLDERVYPDLATRLRASAAGIATEIAQGSLQATPSLFAKSLVQAVTHATALLTHLKSARELGVIPIPRHVMLEMEVQELRRMLFALRARILERINGKRRISSPRE